MENEYVLGIDLGTTSVKVSILEKSSEEIKFTCNDETHADLPTQCPDVHEQSVQKILETLDNCLERVPKNILERVSHVTVCGQMHGVVMWRNNGLSIMDQSIRITDGNLVSPLITWRDSRCSQTFLNKLPPTDTGIPLSAGFGCVSLFWLKENTPEVLKDYNQAGTIQDLLVSVLCMSDGTVTSPQNAASWGYFDAVTNEWEKGRLASAGFPVHLLPHVKPAGAVVGHLQESWHHIPIGTKVHVALGDFQCSVLASRKEAEDAVVNISTSAQVAVVLPSHIKNPSRTVQVLPYFGLQFVATSAALTGGNSLDAFIRMLQAWMIELGVEAPGKEDMYSRLSALSEEKQNFSSSLTITPTLWGERHDPCRKASVDNISVENAMSVGLIWDAMCEGIINNLNKMMPNEFLAQCGVKRIVGTGNALLQNCALQTHLKRTYNLPVLCYEGSDAANAATGAALSAMGSEH